VNRGTIYILNSGHAETVRLKHVIVLSSTRHGVTTTTFGVIAIRTRAHYILFYNVLFSPRLSARMLMGARVFRCRLLKGGGATDRFNLNGMRAFQDVRRRSTGKFRTRRGQEKKYQPVPTLPRLYTYTVVAMCRPAAPRKQLKSSSAAFGGLYYYFIFSPPKSDCLNFHDNITISPYLTRCDIVHNIYYYYYFSLSRSHVVNYVRRFYYFNLRVVSAGRDHSAYYNIMGEICTKCVGEVLYLPLLFIHSLYY